MLLTLQRGDDYEKAMAEFDKVRDERRAAAELKKMLKDDEDEVPPPPAPVVAKHDLAINKPLVDSPVEEVIEVKIDSEEDPHEEVEDPAPIKAESSESIENDDDDDADDDEAEKKENPDQVDEEVADAKE